MHVQKKRVPILLRPEWGKRQGGFERTVRELVRIGVRVALKRLEYETFAQAHVAGKMPSAYGTVQTAGWPTRCPVKPSSP